MILKKMNEYEGDILASYQLHHGPSAFTTYPHSFNDSDEDTEDASETESMKIANDPSETYWSIHHTHHPLHRPHATFGAFQLAPPQPQSSSSSSSSITSTPLQSSTPSLPLPSSSSSTTSTGMMTNSALAQLSSCSLPVIGSLPPPLLPITARSANIRDQIYRDKMRELQEQLAQLDNGTHPEFVRGLQDINRQYELRVESVRCEVDLRMKMIESEFLTEQKNADQEFYEQREELIQSLINEMEEKKRTLDTDTALDLNSDSFDSKPTNTRKLRRRQNDPTPVPDRRRRASPNNVHIQLSENEINEDLREIEKIIQNILDGGPGPIATGSKSSQSSTPCSSSSSSTNGGGGGGGFGTGRTTTNSTVGYEPSCYAEARTEFGKLNYDKKWFYRGQSIYLATPDGDSVPATIDSIGINEMTVKKGINGSQKFKVTISDLHSRRYTIYRR